MSVADRQRSWRLCFPSGLSSWLLHFSCCNLCCSIHRHLTIATSLHSAMLLNREPIETALVVWLHSIKPDNTRSCTLACGEYCTMYGWWIESASWWLGVVLLVFWGGSVSIGYYILVVVAVCCGGFHVLWIVVARQCRPATFLSSPIPPYTFQPFLATVLWLISSSLGLGWARLSCCVPQHNKRSTRQLWHDG